MKSKKAFSDISYAAALLNPFSSTIRATEDLTGLRFTAYKKDVIGRAIFKTGCHERILSQWIIERFKGSEGVFVDVGANLGYFTCLLANLVSDSARVLSFEPEPDNLALLRRNVEQNSLKTVDIYPFALGDTDGSATLNVYKASNRGRHSLQGTGGSRTIQVPLRRLDDIVFADNVAMPSIEFVKIDVEGHEPYVIEGGQRTIAATKYLAIEYSPYLMDPRNKENSNFIFHLCTQFSQVYEVASDGLVPTTPEQIARREDQFDLVLEK